MKIAVVGLGGMGGYFWKLALKYAGSPSTGFLYRAGEHLAAIRREGLLLKTVEGITRSWPTWRRTTVEAGVCDLVLFCVKEYDLEAAAWGSSRFCMRKRWFSRSERVDIAERLWSILPRGVVLSGCVYISPSSNAGVVRQVGGPASSSSVPTTDRPRRTAHWRHS